MINLVSHFTHDDSHHSEWLRQRKWFIKGREDKARREEAEEKLEENTNAYATAVIVATELEIRAFEAKLDQYDTASVTALMENQKQLDAVNARIETMLAQAYIMENGHRVFKTEDGSQVFDEHGNEMSRDEIDFDLIADDRPKWEAFQTEMTSKNELLKEKEDIHAYQEKLDETREKISEGNPTKEELNDMEAELQDLMPEAVQDHVPGMEKTTSALALSNPVKSSEPEPKKLEQPSVSPVTPSTLQF